MMSGPDVFGYEPTYHSPDEGIWYPDYNQSPSLYDLISQGISRGADVAQIAVGGYPPNTNITYSPSYQYPQQQPQAAPLPQLMPGTTPQTQTPGAGIQLSTTTLMLIVGGVLLFTLGKRGR
jgi:hypothetical protein